MKAKEVQRLGITISYVLNYKSDEKGYKVKVISTIVGCLRGGIKKKWREYQTNFRKQ